MKKIKTSVRFLLLFIALSGFTASSAQTGEKPGWWSRAQAQAVRDGYRLVDIDEIRVLYDSGKDFLILDVRPEYEYRDGHLPKAIPFEFDLGDRSNIGSVKREAFEKLLGHDKDRDIIIYCRSYS
jgi:3-mercaptopyruvate sulfurtransferase SseA